MTKKGYFKNSSNRILNNPIFQDFVRGIFKIVIFGHGFISKTGKKIAKISNFAKKSPILCRKKRKNQKLKKMGSRAS